MNNVCTNMHHSIDCDGSDSTQEGHLLATVNKIDVPSNPLFESMMRSRCEQGTCECPEKNAPTAAMQAMQRYVEENYRPAEQEDHSNHVHFVPKEN